MARIKATENDEAVTVNETEDNLLTVEKAGEIVKNQAVAMINNNDPEEDFDGLDSIITEAADVSPATPQPMDFDEDDGTEPIDFGAKDDGLVDVAIESEDGTSYEIKRVTREEKLIITAKQMKDRSADRLPSSRFATDAFSGEMSYYWASPEGANNTTNELLSKGYKMSRQYNAAKSLGHQVEDVGGGRGKVIKMGDLVLFEVPKAARHVLDENEMRNAQARRASRIASHGSAVEDVLNRMNVNDAKSGIMEDKSHYTQQVFSNTNIERSGDYTDGEFDVVQERAASLADAMARQAEEDMKIAEAMARESGSKSYAGFRGNDKFNKAIPESPYLRRTDLNQNDLKRAAKFMSGTR